MSGGCRDDASWTALPTTVDDVPLVDVVDAAPNRFTSLARLADVIVCELELRRRELSEIITSGSASAARRAAVARPPVDKSNGPSSSCMTTPFGFKFTGRVLPPVESSSPLVARPVLRSRSAAEDGGTARDSVSGRSL